MHRWGQAAVASAAVAFGVALGTGMGGGASGLIDVESPAIVAGTGGGTSTPPSNPLGQHSGTGGTSLTPEPADGILI